MRWKREFIHPIRYYYLMAYALQVTATLERNTDVFSS